MMEDDQEDYGALIYRESQLRKKEAEAAAAVVAMKGTSAKKKKKRKRKDSTADDASSTTDTNTKWDDNWQQKFSALQVRFICCVRYALYSLHLHNVLNIPTLSFSCTCYSSPRHKEFQTREWAY